MVVSWCRKVNLLYNIRTTSECILHTVHSVQYSTHYNFKHCIVVLSALVECGQLCLIGHANQIGFQCIFTIICIMNWMEFRCVQRERALRTRRRKRARERMYIYIFWISIIWTKVCNVYEFNEYWTHEIWCAAKWKRLKRWTMRCQWNHNLI